MNNKLYLFISHSVLPAIFFTTLTSSAFVHIKSTVLWSILLGLVFISLIVFFTILIYVLAFWGSELKNIDSSGKVISLDRTDFTFWNIIIYFHVGVGVTLMHISLFASLHAIPSLIRFLLKSLIGERIEEKKCGSGIAKILGGVKKLKARAF